MFLNSPLKHEKIKQPPPSFLKELTFEEDDVLLFYKKVDLMVSESPNRNEEVNETLDLTGHPLEVDLSAGDSTFNLSSIDHEDMWVSEDLIYGGLDLETVLGSINSELMRGELNITMYALCNGKNKKKIVMQGAKQTRTNLIRSQVFILDCYVMGNGRERFMYLLNEHLKEFAPTVISKLKTSVLTQSTHNLYGPIKSLSLKSRYSASIICNIKWSSFHFDIPEFVDSINLRIKTIIGHKESELNRYFKELGHLKFLINLLPKSESDILNLVLNESPENPAKILNDFGAMCSKLRPMPNLKENFDFKNLRDNENYITDILWNLFTRCESLDDLTLLFQSLFNDFASLNYTIYPFHFSDTESNMISKIIKELSKGTLIVPTLTPILSLKLLIECGIEKLKRDYSTILIRCNCLTQYEINQLWELLEDGEKKDSTNLLNSKFSGLKLGRESRISSNLNEAFLPFSDAFKQYQVLTSMHVACDVLALSLKFCELPSLNQNVKNELLKGQIKVKSNTPVYEIGCDLDKNFLKHVKHPTNLHIKFTSSIKMDIIESTFYHTNSQLFPPSIFDDYEPIQGDEPHYYVTKMVKYDTKLI